MHGAAHARDGPNGAARSRAAVEKPLEVTLPPDDQ